jgi:hypothetical protein
VTEPDNLRASSRASGRTELRAWTPPARELGGGLVYSDLAISSSATHLAALAG